MNFTVEKQQITNNNIDKSPKKFLYYLIYEQALNYFSFQRGWGKGLKIMNSFGIKLIN